MRGKIRPFIQVFTKRGVAVPRWQLLKTLLILAFLKRKNPRENRVSVPLGGQTIYGSDYSLISFLLKEKFIAQEYYFKADNHSPVIIDAGASIGISALYFKSLYPHAFVYSFEPYSKAFQFLNQNISANKLKNVYVYNMAIADHDGTVTLHIPDRGEMINSGLFMKKSSGSKTEIVQAVRLSQVLKDIPVADLVKLDVEGAEFQIINELRNSGVLSSKKIKRFILEYHFDAHRDPAQLTALLQMFGDSNYNTSTISLRKDDPSGDLLINAWQGE